MTDFVLSGLSSRPELQHLLFFTICLVYSMTVFGNLLICMVTVHPTLHMPMYFFLRVLSFLDISTASVVVPKMLVNLLAEDRSISYTGCVTQLYCVVFLAATEWYLLAAMAYDRYVAVCNPLHYTLLMTRRACVQLALGSWLLGFLLAVLKVFFISQLSFCGPSVINHFYCDVSPLLNLSCTKRRVAEMVDFVSALLILLIPFSVIIISYICIINTILLIPMAQNRKKAFSTCASHLAVVIIFFSTTLFMYARPRSINSLDSNKLVSVIYSVVTPMLNPFIYCLRNQEIKDTLLKVLCSRAAVSRVSASDH